MSDEALNIVLEFILPHFVIFFGLSIVLCVTCPCYCRSECPITWFDGTFSTCVNDEVEGTDEVDVEVIVEN